MPSFHPNLDGMCDTILDESIDVAAMAAQEQEWCAMRQDMTGDCATQLRSVAVLETLQEFGTGMDQELCWRDLLDWCFHKSTTAQEDARALYDDALMQYLTSAAHGYALRLDEASRAAITDDSEGEAVDILFRALQRRCVLSQTKGDTLVA